MTPLSGDVCRFRERPDADGSSRPLRAATNPHFGSGCELGCDLLVGTG
jgi:hypothetical protein